MLKALAKNGGVIQINFGSGFLTSAANRYSLNYYGHQTAFATKHGIKDPADERLKTEMSRYRKMNPYPYSSIHDVVEHIDHAVKVVGVDHVGLGSDYDGVGDSLPVGLKSVEDFPKLVYQLLKKDYSEPDIKKILGENVLRVWQEVEAYAQKR